MKHYEALRGCYNIVVKAESEEKAKEIISKKVKSFKNSPRTRSLLKMVQEDYKVDEVKLINGYWV